MLIEVTLKVTQQFHLAVKGSDVGCLVLFIAKQRDKLLQLCAAGGRIIPAGIYGRESGGEGQDA